MRRRGETSPTARNALVSRGTLELMHSLVIVSRSRVAVREKTSVNGVEIQYVRRSNEFW